MEPVVHVIRAYSPLAAGVLLGSIWQSVLLTAVVAVGLRLLRGVPAATKTLIWTAVLVLVVALPLIAAVMPHPAAGHHGELHLAQDWSVGVLAVWLSLSFWRAVQLIANASRLWNLARTAKPILLEGEAAALLGQGTRCAQLCVSSGVTRPSLAGFVRPKVLLPEGLLEELSPAELQHVVLHEMEHLRRGDDWLNLLQQLSLVLLPLNPALWWLDRQLCRDRELACDDGVLKTTRAHKAYAACLVKLAEDSLLRKGLSLALSALGTRARESDFFGRVRRILAGPQPVQHQGRIRLGLATLALSALVGTALLPRSPEWIRFDGGASEIAQVVEPAAEPMTLPAQAASVRALPVSATVAPSRARPVLTSAVFQPAAQPKAFVSGNTTVRRAGVSPRRVGSASARVRRAQASWHTTSIVPEQRLVRLISTARAQGEMPPGQVVVTRYEVTQPVLISHWAAVPTQDGWLIVQL